VTKRFLGNFFLYLVRNEEACYDFVKNADLENTMTKECEVTGRRPQRGRKYTIRGIAKKKKGIGLKITGKTTCRFLPNLVKKRLFFTEENRFITLRLSTAALRTIDKLGLAAVVKKMRLEGKKI
jgi:large subunit ribosomal protein L28